MNPVVIIPTYWNDDDTPTSLGEVGTYDYATPITRPTPEIETCLDSLETVRGLLRVVILLIAPTEHELSARARLEAICRAHPGLDPLIIGSREARIISNYIERIAPSIDGNAISLRGYGAIRNMGLALAAIFGHDSVVFLDDDEVVLDSDFLVDAVFGLGTYTRDRKFIGAKTGYYLDRNDSPFADVSSPRWCERFWAKRYEFNSLMYKLLSSQQRLVPAQTASGGCMVIHAKAYTEVAFDPYITRGEDLDYLFNLRMYGFGMWFDTKWHVSHVPPRITSYASRYLQDVYRWMYENAKLAAARSHRDLERIQPEEMMPYPGPWISDEIYSRISRTAFLHAIAGPDRKSYVWIWLRGQREARMWATEHAERYFAFQTYWPRVMMGLWNQPKLAEHILRQSGDTNNAQPQITKGASE